MSWFSAKKSKPQASDDDRYAGKPLLVVLENYVLDCIGHFPEAKEEAIVGVVNRVFRGGDDWKATVRSNLRLDESLDEHIRRMWARNQEIGSRTQQALPPIEFAKMVVDENFSSLIE